jgi:hypothetical protein
LPPTWQNPGLLDFAKWASSLPVAYQCSVLKEQYFDFKRTADSLKKSLLVFFQLPLAAEAASGSQQAS